MKILIVLRTLCAIWLYVLLPLSAYAQLRIDIIGGGATQVPVAVVAFKSEELLPQKVSDIVIADLTRSGMFRAVDSGGVSPLPSEPSEVQYSTWKARGADVLVIGSVAPLSGGMWEVRFRLLDVGKQVQISGFSYPVSAQQLRGTAHRIADEIYEKLTGDVGVFSTRIAYIVKKGARYELQVADSDGEGAHTIVASNEPIISPAWSPDGTRVAYVSFEQKKPIVYIQSVQSSVRNVVANFRGSNSAPAWSPDGRRLAVVLTKDGSSQIYLINADGSGVTRLTSSGGIDTEPAFSPDGQSIIFTSDRGGSPQIYRVPVSGGAPERLTFEGNYNTSPNFAPDGKSFVFIQRNGSRFNVAVQDFVSRQAQVLTESGVDESPTFAPNGRIILYATEIKGRGVLASISSDGRVRQRYSNDTGDVREPAWGPIVKSR